MKLSDPIGNPLFAPFFIRIALGAHFILEGKAKLSMHSGLVVPDFVKQVQTLGAVHEQVSTVYAILLPYLYLLIGGLLAIGLWTTLSAGLASLLLCSIIYMWGMYVSHTPLVFSPNLVFLCMALSLLYSGGGALSVDRFRKAA